MKTLLLLSILTLTFSFSALGQADLKTRLVKLQGSKKYTATFDRSKNKTIVSSPSYSVRAAKNSNSAFGILFRAAFSFAGETLTSPADDFILLFLSTGEERRFLKDHALALIVDGERIEIGEGRYEGSEELPVMYSQNPRVLMTEKMDFAIDRATMTKMAAASTIEFQLGQLTAAFSGEERQTIKTIFALSNPE